MVGSDVLTDVALVKIDATMIFSTNGGHMGVSVAVPINLATKVAAELRASGSIARGHIGAKVQELTPALARAFGRSSTGGALVTRVSRGGGAAERAALHAGDVIPGSGARPEVGFNELQQDVAAASPGVSLTLNVWRHGEAQRVTLVPSYAPIDSSMHDQAPLPGADERLGLVLAATPAPRRQALRLDGGLTVREVHGALARAGVQIDDVVVAVGDRPVDDIVAFDAALAATPADRGVALLIARDGAFCYVSVVPRR
ncbi:MAG: PDZ domain-containing protein [Burkholderiales bacterium]